MNEKKEEEFSFCPKCGALMENGICPACSQKTENCQRGVYSSENYPQMPQPQRPQQAQQPQQYGYRDYTQQNSGYPGYPYQNPQYQNQNAYTPYAKPQKKYNGWMIAGIVAGILCLLLLLVGSFFYGYFVMKMAEEEDILSEEYGFEEEWLEDEFASGEEEASEEEYIPSPEDEYYYGPCDYINKDVSYIFLNKTYTNEDPENDIDVIINYPELKGENIPNIESLNAAIEKTALYYAVDFPKESLYAEFGESYAAYITSYVTYNDEDIISIVFDEYVEADDEYRLDLCPVNIDIKNGVILDNNSLLRIDEAFAKEFRKRNNEQNGHIDYLDSLSDKELAEQLNDKYRVIAYYTPLGMEIGLNYSTGGSCGWLTVTYKDYEEYLAKF